MQTATNAPHSIYHKTVDIFFLFMGIFVLWFFNFDDSLRPALVVDANIDLVLTAALLLIFSLKNGFSGIHLLLICCSYNIHSISAGFVAGYEILYIFSWLANACLLIIRPEMLYYSLIYHLGLSFEPSMTRTTGIGMQMGFYCGNQTLLLLAATLQIILKQGFKACFDARHLLVIFAGLFMLNQHSLTMQAGFTSGVVLFIGALALFLALSGADNKKHDFFFFLLAFILGSAIVFLAAVLNLLIISEGISELLRRRAMAANIHPNRLATFALASIWLFNWCKSQKPFIATRLVYIINLTLLLLIILTGARIILALTLFSYALYFFFNNKLQISFKAKLLAAFVIAVSTLRIFLHFRLTELVKNERLIIWYSGWQNFLNAIWTGHGAMSFAYLPQYYKPESTFWLYDWNYPHAHQLFLELLTWGGVPLLAAFVYVWIKAFVNNKNLEFRIGLFCLSLSGFLDFAWGTASMLAIAAFYLFVAPTAQRKPTSRYSSPLKFVSVILLAIAILATLRLEMGTFFFTAAQNDFYKQGKNWKKYINAAGEILKNDPGPAMHGILWKHTTGIPAEKLLQHTKKLTLTFPHYYAVWFLHGRMLELTNNVAAAKKSFARSLELEPRDLSGIRNARYLLTKLKTGQQPLTDQEILPLLKRGHFGLPMLLFHPLYGETFRNRAQQAHKTALAAAAQPDIDKFFLLTNMAEWGIYADVQATDSLLQQDLPDWAKDELHAWRLQITGAGLDELTQLLKDKPGPALARQIAALFLAKGKPELAIEAYNQHRRSYNLRNKNYEDLAAQFIAARAYYQAGQYAEAFFELERIGAYDQMNPFVAELRAKVHAAQQQKELAQYWHNLAMNLVNSARSLPFYKETANDFTWPEGDHWTLVAEKTLRAHDQETYSYCQDKWQSFRRRLAELGQKIK